LFESQALFIDVPTNVQNASRAFLEFLRVRLSPPTDLVVKHLLFCAARQVPANTEVYRYLNDKTGDPAIAQLKGVSCLWLGDGYHAPNRAFWSDHPFGKYRRRLGEELRGYSGLLKQLGVRDAPDHRDALGVLKEISTEFSATNKPLSEDAHAALMACWQILDNSLHIETLSTDELKELASLKCIPNADRILNPPEWTFFENRAGLATKFSSFLTKNVIGRPLGAGNAYAAAGVRPLGSAVEIELLECTDPSDDQELADTIRARRDEIARVLESQSSGQEATDALTRLDNIRCEAAASLTIRYRLTVFERELNSDPEQVPALYQPDDEVLLFVRREGQISWPAMARELAVALFPEHDPGRFAAGLKEVLAATTPLQAAAVLDELGFGRLDTAIGGAPSTGEITGTLGAEILHNDFVPPGQAPGVIPSTEPDGLTPDEAIKRLLGTGASPPTPPIPDSNSDPVGTGGQNGGGKTTKATRRKGRPVLRSYVPAPNRAGSEANEGDDEENEQSRSPVDVAGVGRVLQDEKAQGRFPTEMPHKNPGFDIESRDASGKLVRYIEVKSFSGLWSNTYAVLSRPQFDKATNTGDSFWLYVVERAESDDFKIYRVQNPALKANHFMFDDGWRAIVEPAPLSEKGE
jgi:hypothetical protein